MDKKTMSEIATELCQGILKKKPHFVSTGFYLHDYGWHYFSYKNFNEKTLRTELENIRRASLVHE
jgi:hypothetical protein